MDNAKLDKLERRVEQWSEDTDGRSYPIDCDELRALITAARRPALPDREAVAKEIRQILTETCRGEIHAATAGILALFALSPAQAEREGWVMVPREPTEAMEEAGREEVFKDRMGPAPRQPKHIVANNVWTAMLSAAPKEGE